MWPRNRLPIRQPHVDRVLSVLQSEGTTTISVEDLISVTDLSRTAVFSVIEHLAAEQIIVVDGKTNSTKARVSIR
jgi:hypothetical protein